jgi:hypothetical protein
MISKINQIVSVRANRLGKGLFLLMLFFVLAGTLYAQGPGGGGLDNPTEGGGPGGDLGGDPDLVPISGLEYLLAGAVMYGAKKAYGKKKKHDA